MDKLGKSYAWHLVILKIMKQLTKEVKVGN